LIASRQEWGASSVVDEYGLVDVHGVGVGKRFAAKRRNRFAAKQRKRGAAKRRNRFAAKQRKRGAAKHGNAWRLERIVLAKPGAFDFVYSLAAGVTMKKALANGKGF
jgi:hypothetical protein